MNTQTTGTDPETRTSAAEAPEDVRTAREHVEQTRQKLGEVVEALADKADVRTRTREGAHTAQQKAAAVKDRVVAKTSGMTSTQYRPAMLAAFTGGVLVVALVVRRRRRCQG